MKNKTIIIAAIVSVILFVIVFNMIRPMIKESGLIDSTEVLKNGDVEISVLDYYNADFAMFDELEYTFDKYLAVDLEIKNISSDKIKFLAVQKFYIEDNFGNVRHFLVDENKKKFGSEINEGDVFDITLVFPVNESSSYNLYYNPTLKEEDERKIGFKLDATSDLETKEVENSTEHFEFKSKDESEDTKEDSTKKTDNEESLKE